MRIGLPPPAAYYLWIPIAVVTLFVAVRMLVRRVLRGTAARRFALVLALLYVSPAALLAQHLFTWLSPIARYWLPAAVSDMWPVSSTWGYPFAALSVACFCLTLVVYEHDRKRPGLRSWSPVLGLLCAWLLPWQGATLLGLVVVTEGILWIRGERTPLALPVATATAIVLPLVY